MIEFLVGFLILATYALCSYLVGRIALKEKGSNAIVNGFRVLTLFTWAASCIGMLCWCIGRLILTTCGAK